MEIEHFHVLGIVLEIYVKQDLKHLIWCINGKFLILHSHGTLKKTANEYLVDNPLNEISLRGLQCGFGFPFEFLSSIFAWKVAGEQQQVFLKCNKG